MMGAGGIGGVGTPRSDAGSISARSSDADQPSPPTPSSDPTDQKNASLNEIERIIKQVSSWNTEKLGGKSINKMVLSIKKDLDSDKEDKVRNAFLNLCKLADHLQKQI